MRCFIPLAASVLVVAGCAAGPGDDEGAGSEARPDATNVAAGPLAAAACDVQRLAGTDPDAARRVFFDQAHEPLHGLADELLAAEAVGASAELLEAKEAVERRFRDQRVGTESATLGIDAERLARATRGGLVALGIDAPPCRDRS